MINERVKQIADAMLLRGFSVIPISQTTKSPTIKWADRVGNPMKAWEFSGVNIAMLTGAENGYVVVDCDSRDSYKGWLANRPRTPLRIKTRNGMHFYYRHPGGYVMSDSHIQTREGFSYDIKGDKSYVLMPPSIRKGHQYQVCVCTGNLDGKWIAPGNLPVFDTKWRPDRAKLPGANGVCSGEIKSARAVLQTIHASEGERDKKTYHATKVCIDAGMSEPEAIQEVLAWHSTNVSPPWSPQEIVTKVRRVYGTRQGAAC
jgi:hypothetical protein